MTVARTCARRRKQMRNDPRYAKPKMLISRKLGGRSKMLALMALKTSYTGAT